MHSKLHHNDLAIQHSSAPLNGIKMDSSCNGRRADDPSESQTPNTALSLLFPSTVHVQQSQNILGHFHPLRLLTLANGVRLLLKSSPVPGTLLLRHERQFLEAEARCLTLLGQSADPCIPQLYHYDPHGKPLGSVYLIRQYVKGTSWLEMKDQITTQ